MNEETLARELWPDYRPTSLLELPALARDTNVARVFVKVEAERPLGNFKVLGGMLAAVRALARATNAPIGDLLSRSVHEPLPRLICASDGNHGLAVATAAARCGARASIYLPAAVSLTRVGRIEAQGADIVHIDGTYDDAVHAAAEAASRGEGLLISDTSADPDDVTVIDVMHGYQLLTHEIIAQLDTPQTRASHVFVQAGVGGLAAAVAEGLSDYLREPKKLIVVEPAAAACVAAALQAGHPVHLQGTLETAAEMLSCGLVSAAALAILKRYEVDSVLVDETLLHKAPHVLRDAQGPETTPSGATGLAGLLRVAESPTLRETHRLTPDSIVLFIVTEGPLPPA